MGESQFAFFHRLSEYEFQDFCNSLFLEIFGFGVIPGGKGRDGGRDALFDGQIKLPRSEDALSGKWCFQVKFHHVDRLPKSEWTRTVIFDLKNELKKLQNRPNLPFNSYLFITNVELTWIPELGTYDQVHTKIRPIFLELGLKNFEVCDGGRLLLLLPQAPNTKHYFDPIRSQLENEKLKLDALASELSTDNRIHSALRRLSLHKSISFDVPKKNPNIPSNVSWLHKDHPYTFYLTFLTTRSSLSFILEISERLFEDETLCIFGPENLLARLRGRIPFLPLPHDLTEEELVKRIDKFTEYID